MAFVAAAVLGGSHVGAGEQPVRFHDALKLFEAQRYADSYAMFAVLAQQGDSRAQLALGSALVHGSLIPRDIPRGIAWLQIAAGESNSSRTTRKQAAELLVKYEPAVTGADLLRADAIAGEYLEERARRRAASVQEAYRRLLQPAGAGGDAKNGCALDPSLPDCGKARDDLRNRLNVCQMPSLEQGSGGIRPAKVLRAFRPDYPERARRLAWEGRVVVAMHVDASGWVCRVTIAEGSGIQSLDTAALEAVRRWYMAPGRIDAQPVAYLHDVDVTFTLTDYVVR